MSKKLLLTGCLCISFALTACGRSAVTEQTEISPSIAERSVTSVTEENVWEGYAQEHSDVIKQYPKWFDAKGEVAYPCKFPLEGDIRDVDKRRKENDLPKEIIDSLDTRQLLEVTAEYPDFLEIVSLGDGSSTDVNSGLYKILSLGMKALRPYTDVCTELMKRKDLISTCYEYYKEAKLLEGYDAKKGVCDDENAEVLQERCKIMLAEYVLCTDEVYEMLGQEEREAVVATVKRLQSELKKSGGYQFPFYCVDAYHFSALARSVQPEGLLSPWQDLLIEHDVDIYAYPIEKIQADTWIQ